MKYCHSICLLDYVWNEQNTNNQLVINIIFVDPFFASINLKTVDNLGRLNIT